MNTRKWLQGLYKFCESRWVILAAWVAFMVIAGNYVNSVPRNQIGPVHVIPTWEAIGAVTLLTALFVCLLIFTRKR
jgi:hypothetical protein